MPNTTQPTVPIEVITTTVQRSVRYVATGDCRQALAAVTTHVENHPEEYDDIDEVIAYHHDVRLLEDAPQVIEMEGSLSFPTPDDLMNS